MRAVFIFSTLALSFTAHAAVDHARVAEQARLVVDFRNAVPDRNGKVVAL